MRAERRAAAARDDARRARADRHAGRRFDEARGDAQNARRLADQTGDLETQLDALVVESLAAAGAGRPGAASVACAAASTIATVDIGLAVRARVLCAIGATRARDGQHDEAVTTLHLAGALAEALGDRETAHETAQALEQITANDSDQ